ncbi:hypothetical protein PFISCL1PPCAC_15689 [Pristionchus fissidentatus]|uniref:Uncharacterized protein n=1 Tax=Pristionchus fissidentatus TaxID=1538716 RepID=A0AAV5W076_9BILA|nr:hypothetical protein PFISCL1PPCAC_15689 [Pristionchus fissidentatus]
MTKSSQPYVYKPRESKNLLPVKNEKPLSYANSGHVTSQKTRPAILSRPTAGKRSISSVLPEPESQFTSAAVHNSDSYCYSSQFRSSRHNSPSRPISPTLTSIAMERTVKRPPTTPSKNVPINLLDMISPNPKIGYTSTFYATALTDNSLLACTISAIRGPTTFPPSLSL